MIVDEWVHVPVGINAEWLVTRGDCRTVLVVVHTVTSGRALLDIVGQIENDRRIQVVFTHLGGAFGAGVGDLLDRAGGIRIPWQQAVREKFDLALAAAYTGLSELHAPTLVIGHGAAFGKHVSPVGDSGAFLGEPPVYGLDAQRLTRDGRVVVSALALSHHNQLETLRRQCPEALRAAVVAGDPCYDRLIASLGERDNYRASLGVGDDQQLVAVTSTWGQHGLFGQHGELLSRIVAELPADRFRVVALLHPAVWACHGSRQIKAWLSDCVEAGLMLFEPQDDWRPAIVASDHVIGDHGSVTVYAAAIGRPVLCVDRPAGWVTASGSPHELVGHTAAVLDPNQPIPAQLAGNVPVGQQDVARLLTSCPGRADAVLRRTMYRLIGIAEPGVHRQVQPLSAPEGWRP
jgi:hypothetical protein